MGIDACPDEWSRSSDSRGAREGARTPKSPRRYVVWLLSRREHSEKELRDRLREKGCDAAAIDDAITFSRQHGFQSDSRYAESRVRSRGARVGDARLRQELRSVGIGVEQAAEAMEALAPESERAIAAAARFQGQELNEKLRAKVFRFLASRGFSGAATKAAISSLANS